MNLQRILTSISAIGMLSFGIACSQSDSELQSVETQASTADSKPVGQQDSADVTDATPNTQPQRSSDDEESEKQSGESFDWPCWRGSHGDGTSREANLIRSFPDDGPKILWRKPLGTGFSGLSISRDRLFTMFGDGDREYAAGFDTRDGSELWKIDIDKDFAQGRSFGPRATPYVDGDLVYFVGASGRVLCLTTATGKEQWSLNVYDKFEMHRFTHEEGLSPSPLVDGTALIVQAGISVFAFNKSNGELIWRSLEERMNHSTPTLARIDGKRQLVVLTGANLVGLSPTDGGEQWRQPQQGVNCASAVIGPDSKVFTAAAYGFGSQLTQVVDGTARQVYKSNTLATHHATAILQQGHLYGFHDRPGIFKCVAFATGEEKWVSRAAGKGTLIVADNQIILLEESGKLLLAPVSLDGFEPTAQARLLKGTCYTAPSLANGHLYLRSNEEMVCIDLKR
ncbi:MAG: PQQ-like beta-propeller repeat protein [Planctomycetota bacterium]|nr:PQQ-like beta-propeller repeat protein [Planctomycetota bacterium]